MKKIVLLTALAASTATMTNAQSANELQSELLERIAVCASEFNVNLDIENLVGSADSLFVMDQSQQANGTATLTISSLLGAFSTDEARLAAYQIYTQCLVNIYPTVPGSDALSIGVDQSVYSTEVVVAPGSDRILTGFYTGRDRSEVLILVRNPSPCRLRFYATSENEVRYNHSLEVIGGQFVYRGWSMSSQVERTLPAGTYVLHLSSFDWAGFYSFSIDARGC